MVLSEKSVIMGQLTLFPIIGPKNVEPRAGFEPATGGLQVRRPARLGYRGITLKSRTKIINLSDPRKSFNVCLFVKLWCLR